MDKNSRIYVAGHRGLVGSAIVRSLQAEGYSNLITRTRAEVDLLDNRSVEQFFATEKPEYVFLAAARVGGILANKTFPADFIRENLLIQTHVIDSAWKNGVSKLLFLSSSCIYPKFAPQPIREEYLLTGTLEPTNDAYAIAKIAGILACQSYRRQYGFDAISVMPTNLYGPGDNFDLKNSHVLPALIRRFHDAKLTGADTVTIWGTGTPRREFLYVDDLAAACVFLMRHYSSPEPINAGVGEDTSIAELAQLVANIVGFKGTIEYDTTKPDGTPRKLLDVNRIHALGWKAHTNLNEGIGKTYDWYRETVDRL